jgi:hypothetical protein
LELFYLLKDDPVAMTSFAASRKILRSFNLDNLIMSKNREESWLGSDFVLLLFRFEDEAKFSEMVCDPRAI